MKRFVIAVAMVCALSGAALAGDVHSTDAPAPQASSSPVVVAIILTIINVVSK